MTSTISTFQDYFKTLAALGNQVVATRAGGSPALVPEAIDWTIGKIKSAQANSGRLLFVGNGGSAAIASHMAIDFSKNGGIPALAFNDAASLTCLANDLGYENVFAHHIKALGTSSDMLVAISSSGNSPSILNAVKAANELSMVTVTLSGFQPDNRLRELGEMNLYVPSSEYGFVEITHLALCHSILDLTMGWKPEIQA